MKVRDSTGTTDTLERACSPDEGVDFLALNLVHARHGLLDLALVRLHVHNENKRVVVLNLLHRTLWASSGVRCVSEAASFSWGRTSSSHLRGQGVFDDPVLVHLVAGRHRFPRIFRGARQLQGLWLVEVNLCS